MAAADPEQAGNACTVDENIAAILRLENDAVRTRSLPVRVADAITSVIGRMSFAAAHIAAIAAWIAVNTRTVPALPPFDSYPFPLLCLILSTESVLLAVFVLMKQNRMSYLSDRRNHLDLQINLLTEREVTRLLQITDRVARHLGVESGLDEEHVRELSAVTEVDKLMGALDDKLAEPS
ncbi:MAG: DUF1003 domain-containing protein [Acetobacteraceae bacterium]|nr:DUF1003 domain-containing protein [Acetobacteraceae bacterium]